MLNLKEVVKNIRDFAHTYLATPTVSSVHGLGD